MNCYILLNFWKIKWQFTRSNCTFWPWRLQYLFTCRQFLGIHPIDYSITISQVLCLLYICCNFRVEITVRFASFQQFSTFSKSGNLSTISATNFLYSAFFLENDMTVPWSFSTISWSCRTWISVDMPICIKVLVPSFLDFGHIKKVLK